MSRKKKNKGILQVWENFSFTLGRIPPFLRAALWGACLTTAALIRGGMVYPDRPLLYRISDALGIAGGTLIGIGLILIMSFWGLFDVIGYGIRLTAAALSPEEEKRMMVNARNYSLEDYRQEKIVRRRHMPLAPLLLGIILAVASGLILLF